MRSKLIWGTAGFLCIALIGGLSLSHRISKDGTAAKADSSAIEPAPNVKVSSVSQKIEPEAPAKTIRYLSRLAYLPAQSHGLQAAFSGGEVRFADGTGMVIPPSVITVQDNAVSYLMLTLHDMRLHALTKNIHRGGILIGVVTASGGQVSVAPEPEYRLPVSRIPRFLSMLDRGEAMKVAVISDSFELRFQNPNISVDQFGASGLTSHYGLMLAGGNDKEPAASPLLHAGYDLAVVGFGAFGGSENMKLLESLVITLRQAGIEVVLLTESPAKDDLQSFSSEADAIARIAEKWDAEVADTWSFVQERARLGEDLYANRIQMNEAGYKIWEDAVHSIVFTLNHAAAASPAPKSALPPPAPGIPLQSRTSFTPTIHNGTISGGVLSDPNRNPALLFGGKTGEDYAIRLAQGQSASYGIDGQLWGLDLIAEGGASFSAVLTDINGAEIARVQGSGAAGQLEMEELLPVGQSPYQIAGPVSVQVRQGELRLIGVTAYTASP